MFALFASSILKSFLEKIEILFFLNRIFKIEEANKTNMSLILYMLPTEMLEKILKLLKLKEICKAQLVCKTWKEIIARGILVTKVAGKMLE